MLITGAIMPYKKEQADSINKNGNIRPNKTREQLRHSGADTGLVNVAVDAVKKKELAVFNRKAIEGAGLEVNLTPNLLSSGRVESIENDPETGAFSFSWRHEL